MGMTIGGWVAPGFERVKACFAANFARAPDSRDVGASFAAYRGEALVVDLWGGVRDEAQTQPGTGGTLANVWSATKGVTAIMFAILVDRGRLNYSARVADYWPEFAENGKGDITVSQLLAHRAGLPGFAEPTTVEDCCD